MQMKNLQPFAFYHAPDFELLAPFIDALQPATSSLRQPLWVWTVRSAICFDDWRRPQTHRLSSQLPLNRSARSSDC
jgi:hypothetical protein